MIDTVEGVLCPHSALDSRGKAPHQDAGLRRHPIPESGTSDKEDDISVEALVASAQQGDLQAQSALVHRYQRRLAGFVRPMVKDAETAKDIVQTTFIRIIRRITDLRESARFESWLFAAARNATLDHLRQNQCRPRAIEERRVNVGVGAN